MAKRDGRTLCDVCGQKLYFRVNTLDRIDTLDNYI